MVSRSYSFRYPGLLRADDNAKNTIFFFQKLKENDSQIGERKKFVCKKKGEGESREKTTRRGVLSDELQHPDWPSVAQKTHCESLRTTRAKAGPLYDHMSERFTATIITFLHHSASFFGGKVADNPLSQRSVQEGQSTDPPSTLCPSPRTVLLPPSQTTNINMGAEQSLPACSSPSNRG